MYLTCFVALTLTAPVPKAKPVPLEVHVTATKVQEGDDLEVYVTYTNTTKQSTYPAEAEIFDPHCNNV
jgi:hypothetical protein